jgi:hypothetical protein
VRPRSPAFKRFVYASSVPRNRLPATGCRVARDENRPLTERVAVHCRGGLGRTGTVAGLLLEKFGDKPSHVSLDRVRFRQPGIFRLRSFKTENISVENAATNEPDSRLFPTAGRSSRRWFFFQVNPPVQVWLRIVNCASASNRMVSPPLASFFQIGSPAQVWLRIAK